jgi:NADPH:quinone reductase-like Zn-dependent oxidoreductase
MGAIARPFLGWHGPRRPVLGTELCGVIDAVGPDAGVHRVGDSVIAFTGVAMGAHAEYVVLRGDGRIIPKPLSLSEVEAAALCFGGTTALHFLTRLGRLQRGERLLVLGGSGCVGSAAVQLGKALGAEVSATCSAANRALVANLGAQEVIDYQRTDFTAGGERFDVIIDAVDASHFSAARRALSPKGRYLLVAGDLPAMLGTMIPRFGGRRPVGGIVPETIADMRTLASLVNEGKFRPVIDSVFPFASITEAHRRVESKRKRGSVVLTMR